MDSLLIILVLTVLILNVIFFIRFKKEPKNDENELDKIKNDFDGLKDSINQSFSKMSLEVSKDMTGTLSRVDEKVASFNKQVQEIQTSQNNFSRILAGVKQYGGLSEFSLATLLQDLLPASQYIANAKMKPDETRDLVEFAVKLQNDVLCPIDSHWPIEKYKAVDEALSKGIPVITANTDDPEGAAGSNRLAYVGQDLEAAGYELAATLSKQFPSGDVHVLIGVADMNQSWAYTRGNGIARFMEDY